MQDTPILIQFTAKPETVELLTWANVSKAFNPLVYFNLDNNFQLWDTSRMLFGKDSLSVMKKSAEVSNDVALGQKKKRT